MEFKPDAQAPQYSAATGAAKSGKRTISSIVALVTAAAVKGILDVLPGEESAEFEAAAMIFVGGIIGFAWEFGANWLRMKFGAKPPTAKAAGVILLAAALLLSGCGTLGQASTTTTAHEDGTVVTTRVVNGMLSTLGAKLNEGTGSAEVTVGADGSQTVTFGGAAKQIEGESMSALGEVLIKLLVSAVSNQAIGAVTE